MLTMQRIQNLKFLPKNNQKVLNYNSNKTQNETPVYVVDLCKMFQKSEFFNSLTDTLGFSERHRLFAINKINGKTSRLS